MPSFLVTGGAGFIGSNIVEFLLRQGESVRVLDNLSTGYRRNIEPFAADIDFVEGDITNLDDCVKAVQDMDYVLHLGALASVPRSVSDPALSHEANVTATLNLLMAARDAKVKRFVFSSSSSVYGDQESDLKSEDNLLNPLSPYASAKASCEHYLSAFSTCYGMETVALRYFNVFGPRQDPNSPYSAVIPLFISAVLEGKSPTIFGDGSQSRDFTFVENNVRANYLAALGDFEAKGQAYNIACGYSINLIELLTQINVALDRNIEPIFAEPRVGDVKVSMADISRARADLGYDVFVDFEQGLKKTVEWYVNAGASFAE
jgi:nucleoside-diphosphate-sugar epimerase